VINNTPPLQTNIVPKVVIKEGIAKVTVIKPLINPIPIPNRREKRKARGKTTPLSIRVASMIGQKQKTEPMERSISPVIKSIVTPNATIPNSGTISKITPIFSRLKKSGDNEKNIKITTITIMKLLISRKRSIFLSWLSRSVVIVNLQKEKREENSPRFYQGKSS
jgi:hypothetical protein